MSVWAYTWAFEQEMDNASAKFTLVALGNFADEHGRCWPSQETLARMTGLTARTVRTQLKWLAENDYIIRHERRKDGRRQTDIYVLNGLPEAFSPRASLYRKSTSKATGNPRQKLPENPSGETSVETLEETSDTPVGANGHIDHIRVLVEGLRIQSKELSKQDKEQYAGQVAQLRNAGKSEQDIHRAMMRIIADWDRYPYTSVQKALNLLTSSKGSTVKPIRESASSTKLGANTDKARSERTEGYEHLFSLTAEQEEKLRRLQHDAV